MLISDVWKKIGYEYTKITDTIVRAKNDGTVDISAGVTFVCVRKYQIQRSADPNDLLHGYRMWTVTNPTSSIVTVNVSGSAAEPAYMWTYADTHLNFVDCCYLSDKFGHLKFVNGGCGGSITTTRHEDWKFWPEEAIDFTDLFAKVDKRLDNQ